MNKKIIITGILAAGVLLGGTSLVGATMNDSKSPNVKPEVKQTESIVKAEAKRILSVEEVKEIALKEQDGQIDDIELETDDGYTYYEVEINNSDADYDIYIDAHTGNVLEVEVDSHDDFDEENDKTKEKSTFISLEEAKQIAVSVFGGKVVELELDEDDGHYEYEVEVQTKHGEAEIVIDAVTGEILEKELDD